MHAYSGEAAAIGAALCAGNMMKPDASTRYRGSDVIESLEYTSTTNEHTTCTW
jgi:predicted benzoate:H+ symporter BenE